VNSWKVKTIPGIFLVRLAQPSTEMERTKTPLYVDRNLDDAPAVEGRDLQELQETASPLPTQRY
jgi:hypothetical protein